MPDHMSPTIKILHSFHYINEKGKDQGLNGNVSYTQVCSRKRLTQPFCSSKLSKELVELLANMEKIRQEHKKANMNRSKYVGTGNNGFLFGGSDRYI